MDFYCTLWSLQAYFSSPPLLAGNVPPPAGLTTANFEDFRKKSDLVLPKLFEQTQKAKELMGKEKALAGQKRKRVNGETEGFFHPRYLTGRRLFEQEVESPLGPDCVFTDDSSRILLSDARSSLNTSSYFNSCSTSRRLPPQSRRLQAECTRISGWMRIWRHG
jgi:hypothetical protein